MSDLPNPNVYHFEGQEFVEVEVDENEPIEDEFLDDVTVNDDNASETDVIDDMIVEETAEDVAQEEMNIIDMSIATFRMHSKIKQESVYCVAIHPTRNLIITGGGDDNAYIWQINYNNLSQHDNNYLFQLNGHRDSITAVGFNFDGTLALSGSYDGTVRIWNVEDGSLKLVLEGPEDIEWAEWHYKGNAVIAGSKDGTIWMWLAHSGQCVQVFTGHDGGVSSGCFTKDGKFVCSGGEDGSIRIWAPKTGQCKHAFTNNLTGHEGTVTSLASSGDGDLLLSASIDGKVKLFQISGKRLLQTFVHCLPSTIEPSEEEKVEKRETSAFISGDIDNEDDDMLIEKDLESTLSVECVGFSPANYKWIASGGMDGNLKIWDMASGYMRLSCQHESGVVALKWHSQLPVVATASMDYDLRVWDARNGSLLFRFTGHEDLILNLDIISLDKSQVPNITDQIVTVSDDGTAKVFLINLNID